MLNIHFHGASVTAQMAPAGFFGYLDKNAVLSSARYSRSAYGASHFDQAGYHFLADVFQHNPSVCLIEWTTTSARSFDRRKCDAFIFNLLRCSIIPVWLTLPRLDDPDGKRQTLADARSSALHWDCPIIDLAAELYAEAVSKNLLRDIVHTNDIGGILYAQAIADRLKSLELTVPQEWFVSRLPTVPFMNTLLPMASIHSVRKDKGHYSIIKDDFVFKFRANDGLVELVMDGMIGPHSPILEITISAIDGDVIHSYRVSIFDSWCYYERAMINPIISFHMSAGIYIFTAKISDCDPSREIKLRKPLLAPFNGVRCLKIKRYSCLNMEILS